LLTHPTVDQLHQLGLAGMAKAFTEIGLTTESYRRILVTEGVRRRLEAVAWGLRSRR
jgi:hypothetical protein